MPLNLFLEGLPSQSDSFIALSFYIFYQNSPHFQPRSLLAPSKPILPNSYPPRGRALPLTGLTLP